MAGPERNARMLLDEQPRLIVAFPDHFAPGSGGTSDMCPRGLLRQVPVWLVRGDSVQVGAWLQLGSWRIRRDERPFQVRPIDRELSDPTVTLRNYGRSNG
jgi:hypothetical protein